MNYFFLDASALSKRYVPELGSDRMHHLFQNVLLHRLSCLMIGAAEVVSVLVRRRNGGSLSPAGFQSSMTNLYWEIVTNPGFWALPFDKTTVHDSLALIDRYAINSTDALVLLTAFQLAIGYRSQGHDLILVASDQRLLRAARLEGLAVYDPETQDMATLQTLVAAV